MIRQYSRLAVAYRLPVGGGSLDRRYEGGGAVGTNGRSDRQVWKRRVQIANACSMLSLRL